MATPDRLFLGYETAFWIWRKAGPSAFATLIPTRAHSLAGGAPSRAKIESFRKNHPDLATEDLDVLVKYGDQRNISGAKVHTLSRELPNRSLYRLDDDVFIASPELCLMQLASKLDEPQAVKLALEMCGSYAIDPYAEAVRGFYDNEEDDVDTGFCKRPPLTSKAKLDSFASRLFVPNSRARSTSFLRYVADDSASPRETAIYMLFCMALRFGGYGFAIPELNRRIELTPSEQLMIGAHHFDCDLYWPNKRVAVEYDSALHHTEAEKQERDAIRRNMLEHKGLRVIVATRKQLNSPAQFDTLAQQVARAIRKNRRLPEREHIEARKQLRKTALEWDLFKK